MIRDFDNLDKVVAGIVKETETGHLCLANTLR